MQLTDTRQQVRKVLLTTLALNFIVALGKIIIGALSGSLAISADGIHSLIDGSSNVVAIVANTIAGKPADAEHPYGHRRFETLAALTIGALLVLTAWEIVRGAIDRLTNGGELDLSPITFAVLIGTLIVNLFVSRYERREGERLRSELLLADAANTGADVFVTLSVLGSTILAAAFGWTWVDPLAALIIVVLIGRAALQVLRQTGSVLVDTAPYSPAELTELVERVPAVLHVARARSRGPADAAQIDIDVEVAPETTADHTAAIADAIRETLENRLGDIAEVEVHFVPKNGNAPDYALTARARADALGLSTHEVRVTDTPHGKVLEMHVEVPPGQTLGAAHEQVTQLESKVRASLPDVAEVVTHIEPALTDSEEYEARSAELIKKQAANLLRSHYPSKNWHNLRVTPYDGGYALSLHITLPAETSLEEAHSLAETAELLLRSEIDDLRRATIHTEPPD
jgi:cation diffusion facilitator family transporter